jgi:hypothetical protein
MTPALLFREVLPEPGPIRRIFGDESNLLGRKYKFTRMVAGPSEGTNVSSLVEGGEA